MEKGKLPGCVLTVMKNLNLGAILYIAALMAYSLRGIIEEGSALEFLSGISAVPLEPWKIPALAVCLCLSILCIMGVQSLQIVLGVEKDLQIMEPAANGLEVIRAVRREKPDVILMDIRMPEMDGVVCTQIIKENYPDIKIIILTTFDDDEYVFNALKYGASGYLLKGISTKELAEDIRKVHHGTAMINEDIASKVVRLFSRMAQNNFSIQVDERQTGDLRTAERQLIALVGRGLSNKEIAGKLSLSEGTVRNSLSTVLGKLGLRDRTQLAIWAVQTGMVNADPGEDAR